jgi:hypothetical protein
MTEKLSQAENAWASLERARLRARRILFTAGAVFMGLKLISPWSWIDSVAALFFVVLVGCCLWFGHRVEKEANRGIARPGTSLGASLAAYVANLCLCGGLLLQSGENGGSVLKISLILAGGLAVISLFGLGRVLAIWRQIEPFAKNQPRFSWGELLDDDGPYDDGDSGSAEGPAITQKSIKSRRRRVRRR